MNTPVATETIATTTELPLLDARDVDVYCWRLDQLTQAGYSGELAYLLAEHNEVDLHLACDLMSRGCSERTAYLILL